MATRLTMLDRQRSQPRGHVFGISVCTDSPHGHANASLII